MFNTYGKLTKRLPETIYVVIQEFLKKYMLNNLT